ncbi:MAG: UDP-N-acetylmuramate dehydrogenase [Desulfovibrio sp.]|nr:UDP-N-acetylmuramate dehydrogenase [Desulfovibrio sp.]
MREIMEPSLAERTTIRLGGKAIAELVVENYEDLKRLPERCRELGGKLFILGKGSNILAADGDLPVVLARINLKSKLGVYGRSGDKIFLRVSASTPFPQVMRYCLQNGLSGLEGLVGIPGETGGLTAMNAGSFGTEIGDVLHSALVWSENGLNMIYRKDIVKEYRKLNFPKLKGQPIVLESIVAWTASPKSVIFKRMNLNFFEKKSRQPISALSAGCAFKNPPGDPAGKLLEMAGFRGKERGGMAFSQKHANFLINTGKGTATAAFDLLREARETVAEKFGANLELEVRTIN